MKHVLSLRFLVMILLIPYFVSAENDLTPEAVFTHIYETKCWGCNEFNEGYSGSGSRLDQTEEYRAFLQKFLSDHQIRSVVDIGCGDWTFSQAVNWTAIDYKGFDVVKNVIEKNKKKFTSPNLQFEVLDACQSELPPADLLICKDVLQHLSNEDIQLFLEKISPYKYCLMTNDINPITKTSTNPNISRGEHRPLDLRASPFCMLAKEVLLYQAGNDLKQVLLIIPSEQKTAQEKDHSRILLAILARNKAHLLPSYLDCIDHLDYNKKNISVYINTNNNIDETETILREWVKMHEKEYESIEFEIHHVNDLGADPPHEWTVKRFKTLALIRNKSLQKAIDKNVDYYFVVDCDNFLAPNTLAYLVSKNKPIIAPLLKSIPEEDNPYSNYFCAISDKGYYASHPDYAKILFGEKKGTFEVPLVHCTYLIRRDALSQLSYIDGSDDYEFIIFSKLARKHNISQSICNEYPFGTLLHFYINLSLEEEKSRFKEITSLIRNWE